MNRTRTDEEVYTQAHINEMITRADRALPMYIYWLDDYDNHRVLSFVPIHAGDFISVELTDGSRVEGNVRRVIHRDYARYVGEQIVETGLEIEETDRQRRN